LLGAHLLVERQLEELAARLLAHSLELLQRLLERADRAIHVLERALGGVRLELVPGLAHRAGRTRTAPGARPAPAGLPARRILRLARLRLAVLGLTVLRLAVSRLAV